jgi:hypothetical protein
MSWCRIGSHNWRCDVYVYEDSRGRWITQVAGRRHVAPLPDLVGSKLTTALIGWSGCRWTDAGTLAYATRWRGFVAGSWFGFVSLWQRFVHTAMVRLMPRRKIGLPFDGAYFEDETPAACADRLQWLAAMGYRVPADVIAALRREDR